VSAVSIAGVAARNVVTPRSVEELARAVGELHAARAPFAFVGGATHLALGNAPRALDTVIRTVALDRVVEYAAEDQTITVEAGMTLAELDRVLAAHGQMLPVDVADRERATVGGVVATNAFGRRRQRYGTVKDLIVGVTIVRPDGTLARGGGKVVKNVAGFDLPKLMTGALGTLGGIASVTFRVHPLPEARRAAALHFDGSDAIARAARAIVEARLEPESVALYNYDALVVSFGGTPRGVEEQMRTLLDRVAPGAGAGAAHELVDDEPESYEQRERAVRRDGDWRFTVAAPPAVPSWTLGSFVAAAPLAVPVAYPLLGVALHAYAALAADAPRQCVELRAHVAAQTDGCGNVTVTAMPDAARGRVDAWGDPPPSLPLMRALKARFDPLALCNPGRFVGGL